MVPAGSLKAKLVGGLGEEGGVWGKVLVGSVVRVGRPEDDATALGIPVCVWLTEVFVSRCLSDGMMHGEALCLCVKRKMQRWHLVTVKNT